MKFLSYGCGLGFLLGLLLVPFSTFAQGVDSYLVNIVVPGEESFNGYIDLIHGTSSIVSASDITDWSIKLDGNISVPDPFQGTGAYFCGTTCALTVEGNKLYFDPSLSGAGMSLDYGLINFVADDSQTGTSEVSFNGPFDSWHLAAGPIGVLATPEISTSSIPSALALLAGFLVSMFGRRNLT